MVPLALASMGQMVGDPGRCDRICPSAQRLAVAALLTAGFIDDNPARIVPVILGVLVVGALIGSINGAMVVWLRFHPLIATLITFNLLSGAALAYTTGPIGGSPGDRRDHARAVPRPSVSSVDRHRAARRAGHDAHAEPVRQERVCRGRGRRGGASRRREHRRGPLPDAGVVLGARRRRRHRSRLPSGIGDPRVAEGLELDSIVAVVIGGVSIFGGRGSLLGVLGGVVFLNILRNAMNLQGVDQLLQRVVSPPSSSWRWCCSPGGRMSYRRLVASGRRCCG